MNNPDRTACYFILILLIFLFGACGDRMGDAARGLTMSADIVDFDYLESNEIAVNLTLHNNTDKSILVDHHYYPKGETKPGDDLAAFELTYKIILNSDSNREEKTDFTLRKSLRERQASADGIMASKFRKYYDEIPPNGYLVLPVSIWNKRELLNTSWTIQGIFTGHVVYLDRALSDEDYKMGFIGKTMKKSVYQDVNSVKVEIASEKMPFLLPQPEK